MHNSVMLFTFFIFDQKWPFWANFVQIVKIVSLRWNLVPRLIPIWEIQRSCSLFFFFFFFFWLEVPFWAEISSKKSKLSVWSRTLTFQTKMCYLLHWKSHKYEKNAVYFILKALFVLKIFKFLSWLFGNVEKTAWLKK